MDTPLYVYGKLPRLHVQYYTQYYYTQILITGVCCHPLQAFETRIHKFNRTRPLRGGSTQKYILMSLLASRNMELDRKTHPGVYITFGYRSHRFRTATMRGDARVVLLNWRDSDGWVGLPALWVLVVSSGV